MNKFLRNLSRLLLGALLLYELFNQFKIFNHPLSFTWLGLIITAAMIWLLIEAISLYNRKKCGRAISGPAMLIATAVIYFDALGDIFLFYANVGRYDQIAHVLGGAAAGGIVFSVIKGLNKCRKMQLELFGLSFFSLMTATFLGVLYELEEYFEDIFTGSHRLGDALDTANDLFLDVLGSLIVIILSMSYVYYRNRSAD